MYIDKYLQSIQEDNINEKAIGTLNKMILKK